MDFFQRQDEARRRTGALIGFYALAVVLIILSVYAAVTLTVMRPRAGPPGEPPTVSRYWDPGLFGAIAGVTLLVVTAGTAFKVAQLAKGGSAVADLLGGRPVRPDTSDEAERRLVNVVEEIALASGTPVPRVYVLDREAGINAFAAGYSPADAVVAVTRGALDRFSRDELQGVIAHEFSHILNGDMRLNIRLMGVLHGILVIAVLGRVLLRGMAHSGPRVRTRSSRDKGGGGSAIVLLGALLMAIGYIGVFFGKLIKSAVSRQREFLADASAVQFTRNPSGIAGALKKIAGFSGGARILSPHADEASHLFFGNALLPSLFGLMATHPPLAERIRRIEPSFDPDAERAASAAPQPAAMPAAAAAGFAGSAPVARAVDSRSLVAQAGTLGADHLQYATNLLSRLPAPLTEALHTREGAAGLIYGLLLSRDPTVRGRQLDRLARETDSETYAQTLALRDILANADPAWRLPLADLAGSALRTFSKEEYEAFRRIVHGLARADGEIELFEFAVEHLVLHHLRTTFESARPRVRQATAASVTRPCANLISCLAYWGADDPAEARAAFERGMRTLPTEARAAMVPVEQCGLAMVDEALDLLQAAAPAIKKLTLEACSATAGADGRITPEEADLIRAIAASLDCPIPPILVTAARPSDPNQAEARQRR